MGLAGGGAMLAGAIYVGPSVFPLFGVVCRPLLEVLRVGPCVPLLTGLLLLFIVVPSRARTHSPCMFTGPCVSFFFCCVAGPHQPLYVYSPDPVADARGLAQPRRSHRLSCRLRAVLRVSRSPAHDRLLQLPAHVDPFLALPFEAARWRCAELVLVQRLPWRLLDALHKHDFPLFFSCLSAVHRAFRQSMVGHPCGWA